MIKHYVEFFYPGLLFAESSVKEIKSHKSFKSSEAPETCYGYQFFDREEVKKGKEKLAGNNKNHSGVFYFGELYDIDRVVREVPDSDILQSNMRANKYDFVVKTRRGNFQPFEKKDKIVS